MGNHNNLILLKDNFCITIHMSIPITASFSSPQHGSEEFQSDPITFSDENPSQSYEQLAEQVEQMRKQVMEHFNTLLFVTKDNPHDIEPDDPETMANNDDEVDLAPPPPED